MIKLSKQTKLVKKKKRVFNNADLLKELIDIKDNSKVIATKVAITNVEKKKDCVQVKLQVRYDLSHKDFFLTSLDDIPQSFVIFSKKEKIIEIIEKISYEIDEDEKVE